MKKAILFFAFFASLVITGTLHAQVQFVSVPKESRQQLAELLPAGRFQVDYGSFIGVEATQAEIDQMTAGGIETTVHSNAGIIQFLKWNFDPVLSPRSRIGVPENGSGDGLHFVQFRGPIRQEWLDEVKNAGLTLVQYYPNNTYLVWGPSSSVTAAENSPSVRWTGGFLPEYRISPSLSDRNGVVENIDVHFINDGNTNRVIQALEDLGAEVLNMYPAQPDRLLFDAIIRLPAERISEISEIPQVVWAGFIGPEPILDGESSSQTVAGNYDGSNVPFTGYNTWLGTVGLTGAGVIWSTTDTGVDYNHPDLASRIVGGHNYPGCNQANPGDDPAGGGHGTHVTGIIGGTGAGGFTDPDGFLYGLGIAPGYSIFAQNPICGSQSSWPPAGGWQEMTKQAILGGAIGSNNSWTSGEGTAHGYQATERTHDFAVRDANFDTPGVAEPIMLVFSAGNSGPGGSTLTAPKEAKNLIVTASTETHRVSGNIDAVSGFSSRGPAVDGRWVPTIAAPGGSVASTRNDDGGSCGTAIPNTNGLYSFCSGTSMAAPQTSGALTLLSEWWRTNNGGADFSPAFGKALLVNTAVDITGAPAVPNITEGWGRIHLRNVLESGLLFEFWDQETILDNTGEQWTITVGVPDPSKPLKISLAWSDAPGAVGANPALVNNLDLEVDTNGQTYMGNVFSGGASTTGGSADVLNNLENVFVTAPGGSAEIRVNATSISGDGVFFSGDTTDQDFALICQNCALVPDFTLGTASNSASICTPDDAEYDVEVGSILGFTDSVTLAVNNLPGAASAGFSVNPVTPPGNSLLTIGNTPGAGPGSFVIELEGTSTTGTKTQDLDLNVFTATPGTPVLMTPANDATNVSLTGPFEWSVSSQVEEYTLEIDDDSDFSSIDVSLPVDGESVLLESPLNSNTVYYWRVSVNNQCGANVSSVFSFTTEPLPGDCSLGDIPNEVFFDDMESGAPGWTHTAPVGTDTWQLSSDNVISGVNAWYGEDLPSTGDQHLISPAIVLPSGELPLTLQFYNHQTLEDASSTECWDGGILEITTDGGNNWTQIDNSLLLTDPYKGNFRTSANPLSGLQGWCGDPQDWVNSIVDLDSFAGETVQFRFRLGTDGSVGRVDGWKIDDVRVRSCSPNPVLHMKDGFESPAVP